MQKLKGDHVIRFYFDNKSHHFFLSVSKHDEKVDGHSMTSHPSLRIDGSIRSKYLRLKHNPAPFNTSPSYIEKSLIRSVDLVNEDGKKRMANKNTWKLSQKDFKRIKVLDKKRTRHLKKQK